MIKRKGKDGGAVPSPPPPEEEVAGAPLGLTDIGAEFVANRSKVLLEHEQERRAKLKELEWPCESLGVEESADLAEVDFATVSEVSASSGGSGGVFFVTFETGKKGVLKGTTETSRELFATRILRRLGVASPHCRPLCFSTLEYKEMKDALAAHCKGELLYRAKKRLNRPQVLLFEYVKGQSLLEIYPSDPRLQEESVLRKLGELMAIDVLFNNLDRLPLGVWRNEGNFGNVLLQKNTGIIEILLFLVF
jgi:hypothetical protein